MSGSQRSADTSIPESVGRVKIVQILLPEYPDLVLLHHTSQFAPGVSSESSKKQCKIGPRSFKHKPK